MNPKPPFAEFPVEVKYEDCSGIPQILPLSLHGEATEYTLALPVAETGEKLLVGTDSAHTGALLSKIFDAQPVFGTPRTPLQIAHHSDYQGRIVDPTTGVQLLSFPYAPFTIVKQALRWQYAVSVTPTSLIPFHGVIVLHQNTTVGIVGAEGAGKTFIADGLLRALPSAKIVVDDWSLVDVENARVYHTGDTFLHLRGRSINEGSTQLAGAKCELVEICTNAEEERYITKREELGYFYHEQNPVVLSTILILDRPLDDRIKLNDHKQSTVPSSHNLWDKSLRFFTDGGCEKVAPAGQFEAGVGCL